MKYLVIFFLLLLITVIILLDRKQEPFQSNTTFTIRDTDDILPDVTNNNIGRIINITQYSIHQKKDKVMKALRFTRSAIILENVQNIEKYSLFFTFKTTNSNRRQILISKGNLYRVEIYNKSIFVKYKNQTIKFRTPVSTNSYENLLVSERPNKLIVTYKLEEKTLQSSSNVNTRENIILGCRYIDDRIINPFDGHLGDVRLYDTVVTMKEILNILDIKLDAPNSDLMYLKKCNFIPKGKTIASCRQMCEETRNCDQEYCTQICEECIDFNKCEWVPKPTLPPQVSPPDPDVPMPPKIKCYEGDGKIELLFKKPNDNYAPIREYIVSLKKSYKRDGIVKLLSFKNDRCGVDSCRFVIRGLDNQDYYNINVRAVNAVGMSEKSNEEIIAPNGERATRQISSALLETDDELKQTVLDDFDFDEGSCGANDYVNYDEHILDSVNEYNFEEFIKNAYLKK